MPVEPVRFANSIHISTCEHGQVYFSLCDSAGDVFATAILTPDQVVDLAGELVDLVEPEDEIGEVQGNA